jgi:hypothetical protein
MIFLDIAFILILSIPLDLMIWESIADAVDHQKIRKENLDRQ